MLRLFLSLIIPVLDKMRNFSYNTKVKSHKDYDGKCAFISLGMEVFYNYGLESLNVADFFAI